MSSVNVVEEAIVSPVNPVLLDINAPLVFISVACWLEYKDISTVPTLP